MRFKCMMIILLLLIVNSLSVSRYQAVWYISRDDTADPPKHLIGIKNFNSALERSYYFNGDIKKSDPYFRVRINRDWDDNDNNAKINDGDSTKFWFEKNADYDRFNKQFIHYFPNFDLSDSRKGFYVLEDAGSELNYLCEYRFFIQYFQNFQVAKFQYEVLKRDSQNSKKLLLGGPDGIVESNDENHFIDNYIKYSCSYEFGYNYKQAGISDDVKRVFLWSDADANLISDDDYEFPVNANVNNNFPICDFDSGDSYRIFVPSEFYSHCSNKMSFLNHNFSFSQVDYSYCFNNNINFAGKAVYYKKKENYCATKENKTFVVLDDIGRTETTNLVLSFTCDNVVSPINITVDFQDLHNLPIGDYLDIKTIVLTDTTNNDYRINNISSSGKYDISRKTLNFNTCRLTSSNISYIQLDIANKRIFSPNVYPGGTTSLTMTLTIQVRLNIPFFNLLKACAIGEYINASGECDSCPSDSIPSTDYTTCICDKKGYIVNGSMTECIFDPNHIAIYPVYELKDEKNLGYLKVAEFDTITAWSFSEGETLYNPLTGTKTIVDNVDYTLFPVPTRTDSNYLDISSLDTYPYNPNFQPLLYGNTCPVHKYILEYITLVAGKIVTGFNISTKREEIFTCAAAITATASPFTIDYLQWNHTGDYGTFTDLGDQTARVEGSASGPYSRFGGYTFAWPGTWTTSVDILIDPSSFTDGQGFEYSVAANDNVNTHKRDFLFHISKISGVLYVSTSNNSARPSIRLNLQTDPVTYQIASADWYTFQHRFYEKLDGSRNLAVDFLLYNSAGQLLQTWTRSAPQDIVSGAGANVGGHRYAWFTVVLKPGGIIIRNHKRTVLGSYYPSNPSCQFKVARVYECNGSALDLTDVYYLNSDIIDREFYESHLPQYAGVDYSTGTYNVIPVS